MSQKVLGVFALAMINVAAIVSLRNFPVTAEYGLASISFYVVAALAFLIPTALVSAEMATMLPKSGGPYRWVSQAYGPKAGFFAIWWSWMESIAWFPAILTFMGATLAYIFNPALAQSKPFMLTVMLVIFWGGTFINFLGMKTSSRVSAVGVVFGTLIPGLLIVGLAAYWVLEGRPLEMSVSWGSLWPDLKLDNLVFFTGVLLGLSGIEVSAFHAQDAKDPQRDYPKAILLSTVIIIGISVLGSLAIAAVVPHESLNIVEGLLQTFQIFFASFNLSGIVPPLALLILVGAMAGVNTWIIGPAKGILASAEEGFIPPWLQQRNRHGVPVGTLVLQGVVGTLLASAIVLMPNIETAYWIMSVLAAQFALVMYVMIFLSAMRLRKTAPTMVRPYQVPGGQWGLKIVSWVGIATCTFAFFLGFLPPQQLESGALWVYEGYLLVGLIALTIVPVVCCWLRRDSWRTHIAVDSIV